MKTDVEILKVCPKYCDMLYRVHSNSELDLLNNTECNKQKKRLVGRFFCNSFIGRMFLFWDMGRQYNDALYIRQLVYMLRPVDILDSGL